MYFTVRCNPLIQGFGEITTVTTDLRMIEREPVKAGSTNESDLSQLMYCKRVCILVYNVY